MENRVAPPHGVRVLDVGEGELVCGEVGAGRLTELENIVAVVTQTMKKG